MNSLNCAPGSALVGNRHYFLDDVSSNGEKYLICNFCAFIILVGTKVLVTKPAATSGDYGNPGWLLEMDTYDNKIWTIARSDGDGFLELEEDKENWSFHFAWCEIIVDQCMCPTLLNGHLNSCVYSKKKSQIP